MIPRWVVVPLGGGGEGGGEGGYNLLCFAVPELTAYSFGTPGMAIEVL